MHKLLIALGATCLITFAAPALAQAPAPNDDTNTAAQSEDDDGFDLGWLGLIGLAGLAGLKGRKRDDHTTTVRR